MKKLVNASYDFMLNMKTYTMTRDDTFKIPAGYSLGIFSHSTFGFMQSQHVCNIFATTKTHLMSLACDETKRLWIPPNGSMLPIIGNFDDDLDFEY
jgi:hypothetical protein